MPERDRDRTSPDRQRSSCPPPPSGPARSRSARSRAADPLRRRGSTRCSIAWSTRKPACCRARSSPSSETKVAFPACASLPVRLAGRRFVAAMVDEVVGDLEGEADVARIAAIGRARLGRQLGHDARRLDRIFDQRAGLELLQPSDRGKVELLPFGGEVHHLPAGHSGRSRGTCELEDQLGSRRTDRRASPDAARISNASACRLSPASTASASPKALCTVGLPRRRSASSMHGRSSWISE